MSINREKVYKMAIKSDLATIKHLKQEPCWDTCKNIETMYLQIVSKLETMFKKDLVINSWFRNKELNDLVGGSRHSSHLYGLACDFYVEDIAIESVFNKIKDLEDINFHKMIIYPERGFIHIGYSFYNPKQRTLIQHTKEGGYEFI